MPRLLLLILFLPGVAQAQLTTFTDVKIRFSRSENDPRLVDKDAALLLNPGTAMLIVNSAEKSLSVPYSKVRRVQFERTNHMRGGALGAFVGAAEALRNFQERNAAESKLPGTRDAGT